MFRRIFARVTDERIVLWLTLPFPVIAAFAYVWLSNLHPDTLDRHDGGMTTLSVRMVAVGSLVIAMAWNAIALVDKCRRNPADFSWFALGALAIVETFFAVLLSTVATHRDSAARGDEVVNALFLFGLVTFVVVSFQKKTFVEKMLSP